MGFDVGTLAKGALMAVSLLAFILSWWRRSPAAGVLILQVGDVAHKVAYVVRGDRVHITSAERSASTPIRRAQDPARVATDLAMAMLFGRPMTEARGRRAPPDD